MTLTHFSPYFQALFAHFFFRNFCKKMAQKMYSLFTEIYKKCQYLLFPSFSHNKSTKVSNMCILNYVDWQYISKYVILSEDFIREYSDYVCWHGISFGQKLSESFIREFQDKVNWDSISYKQVLSESFIREFQDKVNWSIIFKYQELSQAFKYEFRNKI